MKPFPGILWRSDALVSPTAFIFDWEGTLADAKGGVYEGVDETLSFLHQCAFPLFIISNGSANAIKRSVQERGWGEYFKKIVGAQTLLTMKPSAEVVYQTLSYEALLPGPEVWFVGDSEVDLACARASGCAAVNVLNFQKNTPEALNSYDLVLSRTSDLKKILTNLE